MQLTCKVNQAEAIRRGFDSDSTVKLEVDPATLTADQRETLANCFDKGEFKSGYTHHLIPEPTLRGFLESLAALTDNLGNARKGREALDAKGVESARQVFAERKVISENCSIVAAPLRDGEFQTESYFIGDPESRGVARYETFIPYRPRNSSAAEKEFNRLMATDEGLAMKGWRGRPN